MPTLKVTVEDDRVVLISGENRRPFTFPEFIDWASGLPLPSSLDEGIAINVGSHVLTFTRLKFSRFFEDMEALSENLQLLLTGDPSSLTD